jgi:hypothetical protein
MVAIAALALAALGCGSGGRSADAATVKPPAIEAAPVDPEVALREQLHAAAYQVDQALDRLASATESLQPLPSGEGGETKQALEDLLASFDKAGRRLNEESSAPELEVIRKDRASSETLRTQRRADLKDSLSELKNSQNILEDMLASAPPEKEKAAIQAAAEAIEECQGFLNEALNVLN